MIYERVKRKLILDEKEQRNGDEMIGSEKSIDLERYKEGDILEVVINKK